MQFWWLARAFLYSKQNKILMSRAHFQSSFTGIVGILVALFQNSIVKFKFIDSGFCNECER